ncbi:hypothetical protein RFF05_08080 [Bengtsoniella intestinalis]|uniref:ABC transporter substrate-binding protein n=1 Tax=Bengtsoniella intestinalis TaxID=3073143 RepID=UPI00391FB745
MKRMMALILACACLTGCSTTATLSPQEEYLNAWYEETDFSGTETIAELYEAALQEDTLVVYSITTRIYDVVESFQAEYPGLTVEIYDTRAQDLLVTLQEAYDNEDWFCDIVICSDDNGQQSTELAAIKMVNKYVPVDIEPYILPQCNDVLLNFVIEAEQLFYNPTVYDSCPIDNWWALTEPEWEGKIYMNSPLRSHPAYATVHAVIERSDEMAELYEAYFGEPLDIPEGSCAGEIFWEMLVANGLQFTTSSNELVEIIGGDVPTNDGMAFMISSKIRRSSIGLDVTPAYGVAPCDGVYSANSISIAGGSDSTATAKLFIRWLLGETDGTGEGLEAYQTDGTWSVRTDVTSQSEMELDEIEFWDNDKETVLAMEDEVLAFWATLQTE